ncbi:lipoprotein [Thermus islandicus]|uniref:lipoprotein n=1 Tax=Thermus islandicus TaxID=540988 RepID=UPI0004275D5B
MKRMFFLASLALALAACSGHTVHRVEVDLLSFVPQGSRSGTLSLTQTEVRLPNDPAGQAILVPGAKTLEDGRIVLQVGLQNTGTLPADLTLEVRAGPQSDANLYDGTGGDFAVKIVSLTLNPGQAGTLDGSLALRPGDPLYNLIKTGAFRLGARVRVNSGDQVGYTLNQAEVVLRLRLFNLIP